MQRTSKIWTVLLLALVCLFSASCIAPVRVSTRSRGPVGTEGEKIGLDFIRVGSTSREEFLQKLGWIDAGLKTGKLFVGRWIGSAWAVGWLVAGGGPGTAPTGAAGAKRLWKVQNLLVEFDEKAVVKRYGILSDSSLIEELFAWVTQEEPSALSTPVEIAIGHRHSWDGSYNEAKLILGKDFFEFKELAKGSHEFLISREKVTGLAAAGYFSKDDAEPTYANLAIHFREKTKARNKLTVRVDVPTLMVLDPVRVLHPGPRRANPPTDRNSHLTSFWRGDRITPLTSPRR